MNVALQSRILRSRIAIASVTVCSIFALPNFHLYAAPGKGSDTRAARNTKSGKVKGAGSNTEKMKDGGVKFLATPPTPLDEKGESSKPSEQQKKDEATKKDESPKAANTESPTAPPLPEGGVPASPEAVVPDSVLPTGRMDQLYEPLPGGVPTQFGQILMPNFRAAFGRTDPDPGKWHYSIGKVIVKYEGDVAKEFKQLPSAEALAATPIQFAEVSGVYYHIPRIGNSDQRKSRPDPALPELVTSQPAAIQPKKVETAPKSRVTVSKPPKVGTQPTPPLSATKLVQFVPSDSGKRTVSAEAILDIVDSVVEQVNAVGVIAVVAVPNLNARDGEADWKDGSDLEIKVSVSEVVGIRTIARRIPFRTGSISLINDDQAEDEKVKDKPHLWIKEKSPIKVGNLIDKEKLQNYLTRLNRFVGRRVDAALNASGEPGKVILDYLIKEQKPLSVYAQTGNTGTESTGLWRHRLGAEFKQLRNMDDIVRFEYVTSEPSKFQSAFVSYEMALIRPDVLKAKVYGAYGKYSAQDIGLGLASFEGENLTLGTSLTWTPLYWRDFPLDITAGVEWFVVKSENLGTQAEAAFILPSLSIGTDRKTEKFSLAIDLTVQASLGGPSQEDLDGLGRIETDGDFFLTKWALSASAYLEPIFLGKKWRDYERREKPNSKDIAEFEQKGGQKRFGIDSITYFDLKQKAEMKWMRGVRAHEVAFSSTGQYVIGDARLSPQLMAIAGGNSTVRGYPEAFTSGDNVWTASAEYRVHLARFLTPAEVLNARKDLKMLMARPMPVAEPAAITAKGKKGQAQKPQSPETPVPQSPVKLLSNQRHRGFNFRPQEAGGEPDWDLIFRVFADGAQTFNNSRQEATEVDRTMLSIGAGIEFQLFTPLYTVFRLDYGYVLADEVDLLSDDDKVRAGDSRIHVSGTIAW